MREELPPVVQQRRGDLRVGIRELRRPRYQLYHVLEVLREMRTWTYQSDVPAPSSRAIVRARELVLATGPLAPGGATRVIIAPSVKGGVVVTSVFLPGRDVTVALMNNETVIWLLGKSWTGSLQAEDVSLAVAVDRLRALCGSP